jgi:citrate lyase subunit beta / citryl-CoA lyase
LRAAVPPGQGEAMTVRPRRSALFLPASNPRAVAKARGLDADVVILDLEDAVAPDAKDAARAAALAAAVEDWGRRELVVRVNGADTPWGAADLAAMADAPFAAVLLSKVDGPADLIAARAALGEGGPALWAMIETPAAIHALPAIAAAAAGCRLAALVAGTNDLAKALRCRPGAGRAPLLGHLAAIVLAARAAGLAALDGVSNVLDDPAAVEAEARQGRDWGFDGKTLIHPSQIAPAHAAFTPTAREVAAAARIAAAFDDPAAAALGAVRVDGAMVERLHAEDARRTLAMAAACGVAPD